MARGKARRRYRTQAHAEAAAQYNPQIQGKRRGLRNEVHSLRSEEDPLVSGLADAEASARHAGLSGPDLARVLTSFASRRAGIPAGIENQVTSARENAHGEINDLVGARSSAEAAQFSSLLTAAAEHAQSVKDEIAAEGRQSQNALGLGLQEKALGLGDYNQELNPVEEAGLKKIEAETGKIGAEAAGGGLTPYQQHEESTEHAEDHTTAAHYAKEFLDKGKANEIEGVPADPHEWTPETWNHLVSAVSTTGKVPVSAAEKAVGAVRDHYEPKPVDPWGIVANAAHAAGAAARRPAAAPRMQTGPKALAGLLGY